MPAEGWVVDRRSSFSRSGASVLVGAALLLVACGSGPEPDPTPSVVPSSYAPTTVTLLAHDSFVLTEALLEDFRERSGITVEIVTGGDAGELVNRAALTAGNPEGDVLFGVDNTLLSRALGAGVFDAYVSPEAVGTDPELGGEGVVTPVDYGDVCVNYDGAWFAEQGIEPPTTLEDLADPAYRDLFVVPSAATSSPGLAFLLATVARYGEEGYLDYWSRLRANGVTVVNDWTTAYTGEFSGGGEGRRPLVVSYASSPPAEIVFAAEPKPTEPTTAVLTDGCFRQVEYAGVLRGTDQPEAARAVVDWLLSPEVQADVPLSMFVFPVRPGVALPEVFSLFAVVPEDPLTLDPALVEDRREEWVAQWDEVTLR
jgi:thiamine transport system substrate-binding protein